MGIKAIQRIPTDQYAYVELEMEYESPEDAFIDHARLSKLHEDGAGVDASQWKQIREMMIETGEFDPNLSGELNRAQKWWVNETKLALRGIKARVAKQEEEHEPVIN